MSEAIRDVAAAESEARSELVALNARQREWASTLEKQLLERGEAFEKVLGTFQVMQQAKAATLRGFSHDLRSPLFILRGNVHYLSKARSDEDRDQVLQEIHESIDRMEKILSGLMDVVVTETQVTKGRAERMERAKARIAKAIAASKDGA